MTDKTVIVGMARTPMGGMQGTLSAATAPKLGAVAIRSAISRSKCSAEEIDETIMGCVLSAGLGQAPARQAAVGAGIPVSVPATTSLVKNAALPSSTSAPTTTTTVLLVEVPDLVGQTVDFAEGVLSVIGLVLVVDASQETQGESGVIFEQLPEAGRDVTPDTPVVVKVPAAATTTTAATTSTLPTVSTVEIELLDASAEVEEVTISLEAEVHIQVGGFKPFSVVTIELYSEPVELVVAVADADGWIDVTATIPVETDVGEHEIHIDGVDASDEPVEILIPAEIVEVAPTVTEPPTTMTAESATTTTTTETTIETTAESHGSGTAICDGNLYVSDSGGVAGTRRILKAELGGHQ